MAIVKQTVKGHTYLYESKSYRNEEGKPRAHKKIIGKIDPKTGNAVYKQEYLERMIAEGTPVDSVQPDKHYPESAIRKSKIMNYGAFFLYNHIASQTGLLSILQDIFPEHWQQLMNIACYLVSSGEPVMYCGDWVEQTESYTSNRMSPTAISNLFKTITPGERHDFFSRWGKHRCEQEYLALDITSISSYSELVNYVEWGYNRDRDKLPQINLCLLMGEESGLPVFQTMYSGSLKDVSTLKATLRLASALAMDRLAIVLDKGFCSIKNIDAMLADNQKLRFLISLPFTLSFAKSRVAEEKGRIDCIENTILIGSDSLRGITRECAWSKDKKVYAHIYYNALHAANAKEDLYSNIASIIQAAQNGHRRNVSDSRFEKYFIPCAPSSDGSIRQTSIRYDEVKKTLHNCGWLVMVSNHISDAAEAISIYRAKDVVEKGFLSMKASLDLGRLRVHSDEAV
jgi:transposase